jgi:peptide/nickel transport system permease protein
MPAEGLVATTTTAPTLRAQPSISAVLVRFCRKKPLGAAGGVIMRVIVLTAIFANQLQTYDPIATDAAQSLAPPGREHWLGSDHLGRDIYSRIVHGARVSLVVSLSSTILGSVLGGVIGLCQATSAARPTSSPSA